MNVEIVVLQGRILNTEDAYLSPVLVGHFPLIMMLMLMLLMMMMMMMRRRMMMMMMGKLLAEWHTT